MEKNLLLNACPSVHPSGRKPLGVNFSFVSHQTSAKLENIHAALGVHRQCQCIIRAKNSREER